MLDIMADASAQGHNDALALVHQLTRTVQNLAQKQAATEEMSVHLQVQLDGLRRDHAKDIEALNCEIRCLKKELEDTKAAQIETSQSQHWKSRDYTKNIVKDTVADTMTKISETAIGLQLNSRLNKLEQKVKWIDKDVDRSKNDIKRLGNERDVKFETFESRLHEIEDDVRNIEADIGTEGEDEGFDGDVKELEAQMDFLHTNVCVRLVDLEAELELSKKETNQYGIKSDYEMEEVRGGIQRIDMEVSSLAEQTRHLGTIVTHISGRQEEIDYSKSTVNSLDEKLNNLEHSQIQESNSSQTELRRLQSQSNQAAHNIVNLQNRVVTLE